MRKFTNGSTRDSADSKIHYYGFQHPLCDYSYGKYMLGHQKQADGKMREANNWWHGWDRSISLDSMTRHLEDLKLIHAGYYVYKKRTDMGEETIVTIKPIDKKIVIAEKLHQVTAEEACNAIRFNTDAYKLEVLKNYE